jgi:hypothetical protein
MFELHVVVAAVIMSNILELIIEIMPNYPTTGNLAAPLGGGGAEDGGRLLRLQLQDVREASQEEPADGIDLTLKL